ncbi:MAG: hypothetical protein K6A32_01065 [Bacteroidales bacterium]|nr:hypothetical protein [Bacteroidales bacterium]
MASSIRSLSVMRLDTQRHAFRRSASHVRSFGLTRMDVLGISMMPHRSTFLR